MITTAKDIFYLAISGGFVLLVIFLCVLIFNLILISRDVTKITDKARDTVDQVNEYVLRPVKLISQLTNNIKPILDFVDEKIKEHKKKKEK